MSKINQRVELVANVLIIVVALALGGVLVQRYFFPGRSNQPERVQPMVGSRMIAPAGIEWSAQPKTLILALQTNCKYCNDSAPFYKRIVESVQNKPIKIVAVFPSSVEQSRIHLVDLGLPQLEVRESSLESLEVSGTPTLIITNDKGEITDFWVGKLTPDKEAEVIDKLNS